MSIKKVQFGNGTILMDVTQDSVTSNKILLPETAHISNGDIVSGTIINRGSLNANILDKTDQSYPSGYYDSINVGINSSEKSKIIPENIKYGSDILGVIGSYQGNLTNGQYKHIAPTNEYQTILPDQGYDFLTQVDVDGYSINSEIVEATPSVNAQTILPTSPADYISQVTVDAIPVIEIVNSMGGTEVYIAASPDPTPPTPVAPQYPPSGDIPTYPEQPSLPLEYTALPYVITHGDSMIPISEYFTFQNGDTVLCSCDIFDTDSSDIYYDKEARAAFIGAVSDVAYLFNVYFEDGIIHYDTKDMITPVFNTDGYSHTYDSKIITKFTMSNVEIPIIFVRYGLMANETYTFHGKLYRLVVTRSNTVVMDLIPCYNRSSNVGFYDVIGDKFYESISSPFEMDT